MSGKNRTSPEKIGPLVHPDMSGKYQTSPNLIKSYVYTRCDATVITDATTWCRGVKYRQTVYSMRDVAMVYSVCCREFPWRYQRPSSRLVVGFGTISWAGAMKWVQEPLLAAHHYDAPGHIDIAPRYLSVKCSSRISWFFPPVITSAICANTQLG